MANPSSPHYDGPPQSDAQKQLEKLSQTIDEGERQVKEMTERIRRQSEALERERLEREKNQAPWWVPFGMLLGIGGVLAFMAWFARRRRLIAKTRMAARIGQAQEILALILEEANEEDIWAALKALRLSDQDYSQFLAAFDVALMLFPVPWYRPDVPKWRDKIADYFAQRG